MAMWPTHGPHRHDHDLVVRQVVTLRDIEGLTSEEVCGVLEITESNQRVLLHRGRSRLRQAIETGFGRPS